MTTITASELTTLRRKIGRQGAGFTDPQLDAIWVEAGGSMNKALFICFEELMIDAARFNDYTQNETQEKRSQIFDHLANKLVPYFKAKVEAEEAAADPTSTAIRIVGTRVVPRRTVERPSTDPETDWRLW